MTSGIGHQEGIGGTSAGGATSPGGGPATSNVVTFQPGGTAQSPYVFTTMAALCAYTTAVGGRAQDWEIIVDASHSTDVATVVAGTYALPASVKFRGLVDGSFGNYPTLFFAPDVIFSPPPVDLTFEKIVVQCNNTTTSAFTWDANVAGIGNPQIFFLTDADVGQAASERAALFSFVNGASGIVQMFGTSNLSTSGPINIDASSTVSLQQFDQCVIAGTSSFVVALGGTVTLQYEALTTLGASQCLGATGFTLIPVGAPASFGLANNRPAAATGTGKLYFCTDLPVVYVDDPNSNTWVQFSSEYLPAPSVRASWTLVSGAGGGPALTQIGDSLRFSIGSNDGNSAQMLKAASLGQNSPWIVRMVASYFPVIGVSTPGFGLCVTNGVVAGTSVSNGLHYTVNGASPSTAILQRETTTVGSTRTAVGESITGAPYSYTFGTGRIHMRILNDGGGVMHFQTSPDGVVWNDWEGIASPAGLTDFGAEFVASGGAADYGNATIHTLELDSPPTQFAVSAATNASPSVITIEAHTIVPGDVVAIHGSTGNTGINTSTGVGTGGAGALVTAVGLNTITTVKNGNGVYGGGATVTLLTR